MVKDSFFKKEMDGMDIKERPLTFLVIFALLLGLSMFFYLSFNAREKEVNLYNNLKEKGVAYLKKHPQYEEVVFLLKKGYEEKPADLPLRKKKYSKVSLGLKLMLRDANFPDLTKSLLAVCSKPEDFSSMSIWKNNLLLETNTFLRLIKIDKELGLAIREKDVVRMAKVSSKYHFEFKDPEEVIRLVGYILPSRKTAKRI